MTTNHTFVFTLFWTVTFCLGWRITTDEEMVFYWIRKPFEIIQELLSETQDRQQINKNLNVNTSKERLSEIIFWCKTAIIFGKPFVLCITCMASIWGASVFIALNGFSKDLVIPLILNCFSAAFIQTFIWNLYVRISNQ